MLGLSLVTTVTFSRSSVESERSVGNELIMRCCSGDVCLGLTDRPRVRVSFGVRALMIWIVRSGSSALTNLLTTTRLSTAHKAAQLNRSPRFFIATLPSFIRTCGDLQRATALMEQHYLIPWPAQLYGIVARSRQ